LIVEVTKALWELKLAAMRSRHSLALVLAVAMVARLVPQKTGLVASVAAAAIRALAPCPADIPSGAGDKTSVAVHPA